MAWPNGRFSVVTFVIQQLLVTALDSHLKNDLEDHLNNASKLTNRLNRHHRNLKAVPLTLTPRLHVRSGVA